MNLHHGVSSFHDKSCLRNNCGTLACRIVSSPSQPDGLIAGMRITASLVIVVTLLSVSTLFGQDRSLVEAKIREWQQEVARNPKDYETLAAIGAAYGKLGEHATSVTYFKKAIAVNPSYADGYLELGTAYGFLGQPGDAIAALRKGIALDPKNPYGHAKLGMTLGKAGHYTAAIAELKEALKLKPDSTDVHFALGLAYVSIGDRQAAIAEVDALTGLDQQLAGRLRDLVNRSR
jgi:tetratricopeptide (TPR) repeat protein